MKFSRERIVDMKDLAGHMVLQALVDNPEILKAAADEQEVEVKLLVNGHEADLDSFVKHWDNQVDRMVREMAYRLLADGKLNEALTLVYDIQREMESYAKRLLDLDPKFAT